MEEWWSIHILSATIALFIAGSVIVLLFHKYAKLSRWIAFTFSILANSCLIIGGILGLLGSYWTFTLLHGVFSFTNIDLRVNAFSSFFLLIIGVIGWIATLYSIGYVLEYHGRKSVPLLNAGFLFFLLTMALVVLSGNIFTFLVAWEMMSVTSYFLVVYEHERAEAQQAGLIYVVMTHVGTLFLTAAFLILHHYSGSFVFQQMGHISMPVYAQSLIFVFALIGFGTKAGLVPFHIWLPRAHPIAPSHISALMSGVMIKTAIYGFLLFTMQFLNPGPLWWGIITMIIGANTALFGVLHALSEVDQKRMLAYSSIENMGLMFMGIGAALFFRTEGHLLLTSFALMAVLYHVVNHALYKSLLFMGAGAVLMGSHTKNMDLLGGLIRRMPWTAVFMLMGSLAISAMPPMNGFINEWLLFQSIFTLGFTDQSIFMQLFGVVMLAALTFVGALVVFVFIRFFGMTFLALPRSEQAEKAKEVPVSMRIGMGFLSAGCLLLGIFPFALFGAIRNTLHALIGIQFSPFLVMTPEKANSGLSQVSMGTFAILLVCTVLIAWIIARLMGRKTTSIRGETWASGNKLTPRMTYTASGLSKPIRVAFQKIMMPSRHLMVHKNSKNPYFVQSYTYASRITLIIDDFLYKPALQLFVGAAQIFRRIQNGIVQSYLLYLLAALVFVLIWVMGRLP